MKVFIKKYGSLVVSLIFFSLSILKLVSIGTLFDVDSGIVGLLSGGYCFYLSDFLSSLFLSKKNSSSTDPEA